MQTPAGDILYSYHRFGKAGSSRPALVLIQGMGATQYGWPATVSGRQRQGSETCTCTEVELMQTCTSTCSQMLEDIAKTREVVIFDNILAGLTGMVGGWVGEQAAACGMPCASPTQGMHPSRHLATRRHLMFFQTSFAPPAVDTKAGERPLELTVPLMARSCLDLIADLKLGTVPDLLG